jgi:hypothetical protein
MKDNLGTVEAKSSCKPHVIVSLLAQYTRLIASVSVSFRTVAGCVSGWGTQLIKSS